MTEKLLVFLRRPVLGNVKTRLASEIGEEEALKIYFNLLDGCHEAFSNLKASVLLYFDTAGNDGPGWMDQYRQRIQRGNDLGLRMMNAFREAIAEDDSHVVLIGSDCPELNEDHITRAFQFLQVNDIVIGPAADGGFYLIGMKRVHEKLFDGIVWSTSGVLKKLEENAGSLELNVVYLPVLADIDTVQDFEKFKMKFPQISRHDAEG